MPPTTRSMASFGRTYKRMPANATATASPIKTRMVITNGMALDLDVHDFLHDSVADELKHHGAAQHDVADVVAKEELHVVRVGIEHQDGDRDRNTTQCSGSHFAVRADRANTSAQLETLAD